MRRIVETNAESWPLKTVFRISRGTKTTADTVLVKIIEGNRCGYGECVPYARYGESPKQVIREIEAVSAEIESGISRLQLQEIMRPGAARNAVDCALWDLEARQNNVTLAQLAGVPPFEALRTARTISIDSPREMALAAAGIDSDLIKIKIGTTDILEVVSAVRHAAPQAQIILDANEAWSMPQMVKIMPALMDAKINLIEQPLREGEDNCLRDYCSPIPICADESCHTTADLHRLAPLYDAINIKLDKTGGLTEALRLRAAAEDCGLSVMLGCMVCTSLSIAPAFALAHDLEFIDLDGPLWLRKDRPGGCVLEGSKMLPPILHMKSVMEGQTSKA